jgi:uncharacterized membrane protein
MSIVGELVGEVVLSIVGETIGGFVFPGDRRPELPPKGGEWNASLGSLAAFLAGVAALFGGLAAFGVLRGVTHALLWILLAGALLIAMVSGVLAHRALEVTNRRRALARIGLWLSRATILTGLVAAALSFAGVAPPAA